MSRFLLRDYLCRTTNRTGSGVLNSDVIAAKVLGVPEMTFDSLAEPVVIAFELKVLNSLMRCGPVKAC